MAATFTLEILTPDRAFYSEVIEMVILKTPQGEMGVLAGHIPMVVAVDAGPVRIKKGNEWVEAALTEGFMEIKQDRAIILVDTAEWPDEIDERRAEEAKVRAEERLHNQLSQIEYTRSQAALARAMARLKVRKSLK